MALGNSHFCPGSRHVHLTNGKAIALISQGNINVPMGLDFLYPELREYPALGKLLLPQEALGRQIISKTFVFFAL